MIVIDILHTTLGPLLAPDGAGSKGEIVKERPT